MSPAVKQIHPSPSTLSLSKGCLFFVPSSAASKEERQSFDKLRIGGLGQTYSTLI
jgi:hypothetical protein